MMYVHCAGGGAIMSGMPAFDAETIRLSLGHDRHTALMRMTDWRGFWCCTNPVNLGSGNHHNAASL
jgi:hypothetical protein